MRLLIVGTLAGQLTTATKQAMDRGATVTHAADIEQALAVLRAGCGANLSWSMSRSPFANWKTPCAAPCS